MTALAILYEEYENDTTNGVDTKEFKEAYDYFTKGVSVQKADKIGEMLVAAVSSESRRAFLAGVKTAVQFLTGGYKDEE